MDQLRRRRIINFYTRQVMNVEKAVNSEHLRLKAIGDGRANHPPGPYWATHRALADIEHTLWYGGILPGFKPGEDVGHEGTYETKYKMPTEWAEPNHFDGIFTLLAEEPFWNVLSRSWGIATDGESKPAARLVGYIMGLNHRDEDGEITARGIECFDTVSSLWKAMLLGVEDGQSQRNRKGQPRSGNPEQKSNILYRIGYNILRAGSPYETFYSKERDKYFEKAAAGTIGPSKCWIYDAQHHRTIAKKYKEVLCVDSLHPVNAAKRSTMKEWLKHFWQVWREVEGLPVRPPYMADHYTDPRDYGWPLVEIALPRAA